MNLQALKPNNKNLLVSRYQTAGEIAGSIVKAIELSEPSAQILATKFYNKYKMKSAKLIFYFCKKAIPYKREPASRQTTKTLPRILADAQKNAVSGGQIGGDCKHYATTTASLCKALGIPVRLRLISQNFYDTTPTHIYCVAKINGKDIIIDAVLKNFNSEARYSHKYDINI